MCLCQKSTITKNNLPKKEGKMLRISRIFMSILLGVFCIAATPVKDVQITGPSNTKSLLVHSSDEDSALISVLDADNNPIQGLQKDDFSILKGNRATKILSATPLSITEQVPLNVVLVVDNSSSMKTRNAVTPLLNALEEFYKTVRPVDNIHAVVFDDANTITVGGLTVNARTFESNNIAKLRSFFNESFKDGLTKKTYLYDSMMAGLDIIRSMPEQSNKFLLVFTAGKDINSQSGTDAVKDMAKEIMNFSAYAVDFTEELTADFFLKNFAESHSGRIWKAESSAELTPVFQSFANSLRYQYVLTYRLLNPPQGMAAMEPATIVIEEVTTIDSSPLLNYVFFEEGQNTISGDYILLSGTDKAQNFSENNLAGSMDKYRNLLNIIGKRLSDNPDAQISLVGCNSNLGVEKNNITLSQNRAESVQAYLQNIWGIDTSRIKIASRNLPAVPSTSNAPSGIAENRRVEIHSDHASILDIVETTYIQQMADTRTLKLSPGIQSEAGIASWKVDLKGSDETVIDSASGKGNIGSAVTFNLIPAGLSRIASFKTLTASVEVTDNEGMAFKDENAAITNVKFIKKEAQSAQKRGQRVLEQYALILFEYDKADIREHNKAVINRIVARMNDRPDASVNIVGHTDIIGTENYNMRLSKRRAKAVYDQLVAAGMKSRTKLSYTGVGPHHPLYDNAIPQGRALNRTVIVTLEYDEKG
jgi:outer membrane protein OmpA-like peptidoglycan-associated protein